MLSTSALRGEADHATAGGNWPRRFIALGGELFDGGVERVKITLCDAACIFVSASRVSGLH
jgi:hypothetical protein